VALLLDEFANYATKSAVEIIRETRKYGLEGVFVAQEVTGQFESEALRSAVRNTVGTTIAYRLGSEDAVAIMKDMFSPEIDQVKDIRTRWQSPFGMDIRYDDPIYRSQDEIWEKARRSITELPDRMFYMKQRGVPGARLIKTPDVLD